MGTAGGTVAARTGRQEKRDLLLNGYRVPVSGGDSPGTGHTTMQMYPHNLNCTFSVVKRVHFMLWVLYHHKNLKVIFKAVTRTSAVPGAEVTPVRNPRV